MRRDCGDFPSQGLQVTDGTNYRFKTLDSQTQQLHVHDSRVKGVSYSFSGRFLRGGVFADTDLNDEKPVMEGTLTKYREGKKVAEAKLKFYLFRRDLSRS